MVRRATLRVRCWRRRRTGRMLGLTKRDEVEDDETGATGAGGEELVVGLLDGGAALGDLDLNVEGLGKDGGQDESNSTKKTVPRVTILPSIVRRSIVPTFEARAPGTIPLISMGLIALTLRRMEALPGKQADAPQSRMTVPTIFLSLAPTPTKVLAP